MLSVDPLSDSVKNIQHNLYLFLLNALGSINSSALNVMVLLKFPNC